MSPAQFRTPLTAAALALLLSACGGSDGGSNRIVANSPAAPNQDGTISTNGRITDTSGTITPPAGNTPTPPAAPAPPAPPADSNTPPPATGGTPATPPPTDTPSTVTPSVNAIAPITAAGVSGDVLLTMMDQKVCAPRRARQTTAHNGTLVTGPQANLPELDADLLLTPSNYVALPGAPSLGSIYALLNNISCDANHYRYQPAAPGSYSLLVFSRRSLRDEYLGQTTERQYNTLSVDIPLTITPTSATLGRASVAEASAIKKPAGASGDEKHTLTSSKAFGFERNARISYGVLNQWTQGAHLNKLMLLPAGRANQARLCWNAELRLARRLHCVIWQIPANWKRGEQLEVVDQYLVDDRSTYPNERGFLYWRSKLPE